MSDQCSLKLSLLPDLERQKIREEMLIQLKKELNSKDLKILGQHYWSLLPWYQKLFSWVAYLSVGGWIGLLAAFLKDHL